MGNHADTDAYQQMIQTLQSYLSDLQEQCQTMQSAGEDCLDNTDNDDNVKPLVGELEECIGKIQSTFSEIEAAIQHLQRQLQKLLESGA